MEGIYGGTVCVLIDVPEETALPIRIVAGQQDVSAVQKIINGFERRDTD